MQRGGFSERLLLEALSYRDSPTDVVRVQRESVGYDFIDLAKYLKVLCYTSYSDPFIMDYSDAAEQS